MLARSGNLILRLGKVGARSGQKARSDGILAVFL